MFIFFLCMTYHCPHSLFIFHGFNQCVETIMYLMLLIRFHVTDSNINDCMCPVSGCFLCLQLHYFIRILFHVNLQYLKWFYIGLLYRLILFVLLGTFLVKVLQCYRMCSCVISYTTLNFSAIIDSVMNMYMPMLKSDFSQSVIFQVQRIIMYVF